MPAALRLDRAASDIETVGNLLVSTDEPLGLGQPQRLLERVQRRRPPLEQLVAERLQGQGGESRYAMPGTPAAGKETRLSTVTVKHMKKRREDGGIRIALRRM